MAEETTLGSGVAGLVGALGWLTVIGGGCLFGYGVYMLMQSDFGIAAGGPLMASGAATFAPGLLCIVNATMARAMIATANNTARLLDSGAAAKDVSITDATTGDDDLPPLQAPSEAVSDGETEATGADDPGGKADQATDRRSFEPTPYTPPIVPDTSDPRGWPLAIDEFNIDGHLAMTLEDGTIAVETPVGWRRLPDLDAARTWLAQQPR